MYQRGTTTRGEMRMTYRVLATLWAMMLTIGTAWAEPRPVVLVELFTSQGCSSCPPADELLAELATRDDVLPLALHVDYWDYIGWADSFARPEHTKRQKAYAHVAGARSIYTPQMVVGGVDHVVGFKPMKVVDYMEANRAKLADVAITVRVADGVLTVECKTGEGDTLPKKILVDLVRYEPSHEVEIRHGENAGRTFTYANIVRDWQRLAKWDGVAPITLTTEAGTGRHALILQEPGPGRVLAAYRLD